MIYCSLCKHLLLFYTWQHKTHYQALTYLFNCQLKHLESPWQITLPHLVVFASKHRFATCKSTFRNMLLLRPSSRRSAAHIPSLPRSVSSLWLNGNGNDLRCCPSQCMLGTQMERTEGERENWSVRERKRGKERVWELMLTTDVCHSSLSAVTLFLALYQTHNRRSSCSIYMLKADI